MNNAKKLLGFALLLGSLATGSVIAGPTVVYNSLRNPYDMPPESFHGNPSADYPDWANFNFTSKQPICVELGSARSKCNVLKPGEKHSSVLPLNPEKLFVSYASGKKFGYQVLEFDLAKVRAKHNLSISKIDVNVGHGIDSITVNPEKEKITIQSNNAEFVQIAE